MFMAVTLGDLGDPRFSIPDRFGHLFRHTRRHPRRRASALAPVGARRHADQFGEASAEGAQRRVADCDTDLGDAEVATTQQRHRALDAPRHQIAVRRIAVCEPELAAEVPGRHVRTAGERLDVQRLRVLPVDPVADAAQPCEVAQMLVRGGSAGHTQDRTSRRRRYRTPRPLCLAGSLPCTRPLSRTTPVTSTWATVTPCTGRWSARLTVYRRSGCTAARARRPPPTAGGTSIPPATGPSSSTSEGAGAAVPWP